MIHFLLFMFFMYLAWGFAQAVGNTFEDVKKIRKSLEPPEQWPEEAKSRSNLAEFRFSKTKNESKSIPAWGRGA